LNGIRQFKIAIEAGDISDDSPGAEKGDHNRNVVLKRIDSRVAAEKLEVGQQGSQLVGSNERNTRHREILQQGDGTQELRTSVEHNIRRL